MNNKMLNSIYIKSVKLVLYTT